jgi:hypothetical protein
MQYYRQRTANLFALRQTLNGKALWHNQSVLSGHACSGRVERETEQTIVGLRLLLRVDKFDELTP